MSRTVDGVVYSEDLKTVLGVKDCYSNIKILDGVKTIMPGAFKDKKELQNITFPNSLRTIGAEAFSGCLNLQNCIIPNSVNRIGEKAFYNCMRIKKLRLSNRLEKLEPETFKNCFELEELLLPNYLLEIGRSCFENCSAIKSLFLPSDITLVAENAFSECTGIVELFLNDGIQYIESGAFRKTAINNVEIPESVCLLEPESFGYCDNLQKISWNTKMKAKSKLIKNAFIGSPIKTVIKRGKEFDYDNFVNSLDEIIDKKTVANAYGMTEKEFDKCLTQNNIKVNSIDLNELLG